MPQQVHPYEMSRGQMRTRGDEPVKYNQDFLPEREQLYAHYRPTSSIHHQPANNPYQPVCASLCVLHTPWQPCVHGTWPSANCAKNMKALADFDGQVHSDCLQSSEYLARYQPRSTAHELPTSADTLQPVAMSRYQPVWHFRSRMA